MNKLGIIVDGPGDLLSIKKRYPGQFRVLKTDGPRGHCSPISDIISKSRKQISMLYALKCEKAIILLDFECRKTTFKKFIKDLEIEIKKHSFPITTEIVVANTMIENWYLADIEILSKRRIYIKDKLRQRNYEGKHGKNELKKLFKPKYSYSETDHGPDLFAIIRENIATENSSSFKYFLNKLNY